MKKILCFLVTVNVLIQFIESAPAVVPKYFPPQSDLLHYEFVQLPNHAYRFSYTTSDGQTREEKGYLKDIGETSILVKEGSYSYIGPDGVPYKVTYKSDENGYVPVIIKA